MRPTREPKAGTFDQTRNDPHRVIPAPGAGCAGENVLRLANRRRLTRLGLEHGHGKIGQRRREIYVGALTCASTRNSFSSKDISQGHGCRYGQLNLGIVPDALAQG